jgi:hypothetical protein
LYSAVKLRRWAFSGTSTSGVDRPLVIGVITHS